MKAIKIVFKMYLVFMSMLFTAGCEKSETYIPEDQNTIAAVLADNFNLTKFTAAAKRGSLTATLREPGPFTVLAPSDDAFTAAGYADIESVLSADAGTMSTLVNYHALDGYQDFNELPFGFSQELISRGGKLYVTRWIKDADTVLTVNGIEVLRSIQTSNGIIQVLDGVLNPAVHDRLGDAIATQSDATLFSHALYRSGLLPLINGDTPYTVFAPNNAAMESYGYTLAQIEDTPQEELATFVRYHLMQDKKFINDYSLLIEQTAGTRLIYFAAYNFWYDTPGMWGEMTMEMANGNPVKVIVGSYNLGYPLIGTVFDFEDATGNTCQVVRGDIATGNGMLHIINGVLR